MALEETVLRTSPQYWTAAVYNSTSRGLIFKGWLPTQKQKWPSFLDRVMKLPLGTQSMPYYWDGTKWVNDRTGNTAAFMRVSGDERETGYGQRAKRAPGACNLKPLVSIGALERRSPLPPGRYWQDIFAKQANDWNAWLAPALASDAVTIEKVEHFNADPLHDGSWLPGGPSGDLNVIGDRTWVLFNVVRPVDWPGTKLGFPTIATANVQASADTAQNPPGPTPGQEITTFLDDNLVKPALYIGGGYLLLKLLLSLRK